MCKKLIDEKNYLKKCYLPCMDCPRFLIYYIVCACTYYTHICNSQLSVGRIKCVPRIPRVHPKYAFLITGVSVLLSPL